MRVLAAPDKFRGTATAAEVAGAIAAGVADAGGQAVELPLADGGEGTLAILGGPNRWTTVRGPLGEPVRAGWRLDETGTAVIEMAAASGLALVGGALGNDAWAASTHGTGELIAAATDAGARTIMVGLGGSATTDGGRGAVDVLLAHPRWAHLGVIRQAADPALRVGAPIPGPDGPDTEPPELVVCCDVNTLFRDAAAVFGPQKGADAAMVSRLGARLDAHARAYRAAFGFDVTTLPGAGAAGGLAGALAVLGGRLTSGFGLLADVCGLDAALRAVDLAITGEGRLDVGSFDGKVVGGVVERAARAGKPVLVIVGEVVGDPPPGVRVISIVERFGLTAALADTVTCVRRAIAEEIHVLTGHQ